MLNWLIAAVGQKRYTVKCYMVRNGRYRSWTEGPFRFRIVAEIVCWLRTVEADGISMRARVVTLCEGSSK